MPNVFATNDRQSIDNTPGASRDEYYNSFQHSLKIQKKRQLRFKTERTKNENTNLKAPTVEVQDTSLIDNNKSSLEILGH